MLCGVAYSFAAFFRSFGAEFAAERADVSFVFGLSGLLYFLLGVGMLADCVGPRRVCAAGMVFIAAGLLASSFAHSMAAIYVAWGGGLGIGLVYGAGDRQRAAVVHAPARIRVGHCERRHRRRHARAAAARGRGDRRARLASGAACGRRGRARRRRLRRAPARAAAGAAAGMTLGAALRSRRFGWMYVACVFAAPAMFIPFAHVSAAARNHGIGDARAVGLVSLIGVGSIVGRLAIGGLADRFGRIASIALLEAAMGVAYLLWLGAGGYPMLAIVSLLLGLSYGGIVSLMPAICMDLFGAHAASSILGTL